MTEFVPFPKIARLNREVVVTEKIDGTNACVVVSDDGTTVTAQSRSRIITPGKDDNFGFAAWVEANAAELLTLGPGHHFGEWWGRGIQRGYGLSDRRFSLFNVARWGEGRPACCHVVPTLLCATFNTDLIRICLSDLRINGSSAAPGFMEPEGVIVYHVAANKYFKATIHGDDVPKGAAK